METRGKIRFWIERRQQPESILELDYTRFRDTYMYCKDTQLLRIPFYMEEKT